MDTIQKHVMGRPTKYDPSMIQVAQVYIDRCSREATELPTIEGLALELGLDDERIGEYAQKYPEFHATIKTLKSKQKNQLMNDGMYGGKEVNSAMAIFLLKANHGLIETSRTELTGENGQPITILAAKGFIPPNTPIDATSTGCDAEQPPEVQDNNLAPPGEKNNNGNL